MISLHEADQTLGLDGQPVPRSILITPNLVVVGTVNIDETVQPFSDKVKDRANTIIVPIDITTYADRLRTVDYAGNNSIKKKAFAFAKSPTGEQAISLLLNLYRVLELQQIHFGYRIFDEILAYLAENDATKLLTNTEALDLQVQQKIPPKIRGRGSAMEKLLACPDGKCDNCISCICIRAQLPDSSKRIVRMVGILRETGFTSYDAAT